MKEDIINIINILGVGHKEIVVNIELDKLLIDTIEIRNNDTIIIHHFMGDLDLEIDYEDIDLIYQKEIYYTLNSLLYN